MFIEFMQLLSIFRLTRIGVVWRSAAEAVLLAMSITPISSYSWMSLECMLRAALAPQQYAYATTLASTYIPGAQKSELGRVLSCCEAALALHTPRALLTQWLLPLFSPRSGPRCCGVLPRAFEEPAAGQAAGLCSCLVLPPTEA
jgi:hypothetical protein